MVATASILDLWPDLVDDKTGIVRAVKELFIDDDEPAFVHYLSYACDTSAFGFLPNFGNNGGVGTTARSAIAKALGEAVERYCSALFRYEDLEWAAYGELDLPATHPETFALYSAGQYAVPGFSWQRFTVDTRVAWVRGTSLVSGAPVLVPAAFTFVPYHFQRERGDTPITQPISTGLACGGSFADAARSALCEVIERDAFTRTWQAVQQRPRIEESTLPAQLLDLIDRYAAVDLAVHLLDITSDVGAPTILSVAEGFAATSPAIAVAAATHPDPVVAVRKSLEELAHTRKYAAQVMDYLPPVPVDLAGGHPQVDGQRAHLRFYCPQEAKSAASFLWSSELRIHLDEVARPADDELSALVAAVAATGQEVVAVELTSPDIADLGLHVVRVIVPGFHPLQMGHSNRCLGGDRLAADLWVAGRGPDDDNPYPHPFP
ncbi:YcaO-like family protein [Nostocoides sp.]|jgi:ribosomal protein S12 methylthiotransferase accessory factor|uniref:YcaO-like family protein n=1 Tax=Nostocoides sp. TaxID=1917966 RepID=UPI003BAF68A6